MAPGSQGLKCRHSGIYLLGDNPHRNVTQSHLQWLKFVKNIGTILQLGLRRRKFAGRHGIVETRAGVGPVAERLVGRLSAAAEGDYGPSGQAERGPGGVEDLEVAFNADGSVVQDYNFSWHHRDGSTSTFWGLRSGVKELQTRDCGTKPIPFSDTSSEGFSLPTHSVPVRTYEDSITDS